MRNKRSFGAVLIEHGGVGPGFDVLRLALAIAIFLAHASHVAGTRSFIAEFIDLLRSFVSVAGAADANIVANVRETMASGSPWLRPIVITHVPMFFALSGFLVTGSAFRVKSVVPFLGLRFLRIFPALCVEVTLSAILIGALFTTLPLSEYFSNREFFSYFGNTFGFVQMHLPGVWFREPGDFVVNANLWTLPSEFYCYLILAAMIMTGLAFNRVASTVLFCVATVALIIANVFYGYNARPWILTDSVNVYYFFVGCMFFHWRERIPYSWPILLVCLPVVYALEFSPRSVFIVPALVAYITIFIGCSALPTSKWLTSGDYSYGIYLYGFPIMQMVSGLVPGLHGKFFSFTAVTLTLTILFAVMSWHLIEKHCLKLKKFITRPRTAAKPIVEGATA